MSPYHPTLRNIKKYRTRELAHALHEQKQITYALIEALQVQMVINEVMREQIEEMVNRK